MHKMEDNLRHLGTVAYSVDIHTYSNTIGRDIKGYRNFARVTFTHPGRLAIRNQLLDVLLPGAVPVGISQRPRKIPISTGMTLPQ